MKSRAYLGKKTTYRGRRYRSAFEATIAEQLTASGVPFDYETTSIFILIPKVYVVDFQVQGMEIETKGYLSPKDRQALLAAKKAYPEARPSAGLSACVEQDRQGPKLDDLWGVGRASRIPVG